MLDKKIKDFISFYGSITVIAAFAITCASFIMSMKQSTAQNKEQLAIVTEEIKLARNENALILKNISESNIEIKSMKKQVAGIDTFIRISIKNNTDRINYLQYIYKNNATNNIEHFTFDSVHLLNHRTLTALTYEK